MMNQDGQPLPQIEQISGKRNSGIGLHDSGCCIFRWSASDAFSGSILASAPTKINPVLFPYKSIRPGSAGGTCPRTPPNVH
jgi:hypothetical protein